MSTDVIELGSSDDEREPVPKKKKMMPNAMVRFPCQSQVSGISVKPAKTKKIVPCFGINNTVTISNPRHSNNSLLKPILKKLSVTSNSLPNRISASPKPTSSKLLKKLPPSITVKKATSSKNVRIPIQKPKMVKTVVGQVVLPFGICNESITLTKSKPLPQWYKTPEDQESENQRQNKSTISMEEKNNTEPATLIEITIDDSPIKVPVTQQKAIIIDDSPNKAATKVNNELNQIKEKQSKKMLNYDNIKIVENSMGMIEVEVDAIDAEQIRNDPFNTQLKKIHNDEVVQNVIPDKLFINKINETLDGENTVTDFANEKKVNVKGSTSSGNEEFNSIYQKFIDTCFRIENSNDMQYIVERKIKSYYRQCPKEYVDSEEFLDLVAGKIIAIEASPNKMYLYIRDVVNELNIQRKMAKASTSKINDKSAKSRVNITYKSDCDTKRQRQINKLDKTLTKLHRAIQKLEEQEVDFDEEDDSIYLLTERYKERFLRVHAKFCQLTQTKMPSEPYVKLDSLPGRPKGPAARLEKWINKKVPIGKPLPFPDFHDVLHCVREANTEDKLGWSEIEILEEARELFTSCGKKLKRRRQENEWRIAASRLRVNEDPAENDVELKTKLDQNKMLAKRNEAIILNKYVDRQNQLNLEPEVIGDKEAEESPIESDEDDVMQTEEIEKVEEKETNVETHSESNKDDSSLLQKLYSESDSDSPINLTDSENETSFPKVINSDVISIEDSSYSESENCIDSPDECSNIGDTQSNYKEYLTVDITEDIQEILSSKNEIGGKVSADDGESSKDWINVDESNDIEILNDKTDLGVEIIDEDIENTNVGDVGKNNSCETKVIRNTDTKGSYSGVQLKDKQIKLSEKSTESERTRVDDELVVSEVTDTNKNHTEKGYIENEKMDINIGVQMKDDLVASVDKSINVNKKIDVEVINTDFEPLDKNANESKVTEVEYTKADKSNFEIATPSTHTDLKILVNNVMTEKTDVEMNDTDITIVGDVDNERNVKSTDKSIDADDDGIDIRMETCNDDSDSIKVGSGVPVSKDDAEKSDFVREIPGTHTDLKILDSNVTDNTDVEMNEIDMAIVSNRDNEINVTSEDKSADADKENKRKFNGDTETANVGSSTAEHVSKHDSKIMNTSVDGELSKKVIHVDKSNGQTKMMEDCSDMAINNIESEITNHSDGATNEADKNVTLCDNLTTISDICTKIIENMETIANTNASSGIVNESMICTTKNTSLQESELNTERKQRKQTDNLNEKETRIYDIPIDGCRNLENNSSLNSNTEIDKNQ